MISKEKEPGGLRKGTGYLDGRRDARLDALHAAKIIRKNCNFPVQEAWSSPVQSSSRNSGPGKGS